MPQSRKSKHETESQKKKRIELAKFIGYLLGWAWIKKGNQGGQSS